MHFNLTGECKAQYFTMLETVPLGCFTPSLS